MSEYEKEVIEGLVSGEMESITLEEIATRMNEKQDELDQEVKKIEQLDIEAQEKSMFCYVR